MTQTIMPQRRTKKVNSSVPLSDDFRKKYVNRIKAAVSKKNNIVYSVFINFKEALVKTRAICQN
jgi:ribosomal protein L20